MPNPAPVASNLGRISNFLHHPATQLPLYGALAAGDIEAGLEERKKGKSGLLPFAGAGALSMMAAPYVIDLLRMMKKGQHKTASEDDHKIMVLKSVL